MDTEYLISTFSMFREIKHQKEPRGKKSSKIATQIWKRNKRTFKNENIYQLKILKRKSEFRWKKKKKAELTK